MAQVPVPVEVHARLYKLLYGHPDYVPHTTAVIDGGRAGAKCLGLGTPVLMYDGNIRPVESVAVGDLLMGPDNKPRTVLSVASGYGPMYLVKQKYGIDYAVNDAHILSLTKSQSAINDIRIIASTGNPRNPGGRYPNDPAITNINVEEYTAKSPRWKSHFSGYRAGFFDFPEQPVPIDPYFLGLWLGDGNSRSPRIYSMDQEIIDWCHDFANRSGMECRQMDEPAPNKCKSLAFTAIGAKCGTRNKFREIFNSLDLFQNKHIPHCYIANSESVRLQVLAGLLDTDGNYRGTKRGFMITQTKKALAKSIKHLCDTLGFRCSLRLRKTSCRYKGELVIGSAWSLSISGEIWKIPCKVERKKALEEPTTTNKLLSGITVEKIQDGEWHGFEIDGDHLFCLGDGTVTHNTVQLHKIALLDAIQRPLRILCARESMESIGDSTHATLRDLIYEHQMAKSQNGPFEIQDRWIGIMEGSQIRSEFLFVGVRQNIRDKKSIKGIDLTIFDEAAKASKDTIDVFLPTVIRKPGSRFWAIANWEVVNDPAYRYFVLEPPSNCIRITVNYTENPWLSEESRILAEDCKRRDLDEYLHIWGGEPKEQIKGAIFGAELKKMKKDGRICRVPVDITRPVHWVWDLGYEDHNVALGVQLVDEWIRVVHCLADNHRLITDYIIETNNYKYSNGIDFLPHDAINTIIHKNLVVNRKESVEQAFRNAGREPRMVPMMELGDQIELTRRKFPNIKIDDSCLDLITSLGMYSWGDPSPSGTLKTKPKHDVYSHRASAFMYICAAENMMKPKPKPAAFKQPNIPRGPYAWLG